MQSDSTVFLIIVDKWKQKVQGQNWDPTTQKQQQQRQQQQQQR